jgi:hypothetical protein
VRIDNRFIKLVEDYKFESAPLPRLPKPNIVADSLLALVCARVGVNVKDAHQAKIEEQIYLNQKANKNSVGYVLADKWDVQRDLFHVQQPFDKFLDFLQTTLLKKPSKRTAIPIKKMVTSFQLPTRKLTKIPPSQKKMQSDGVVRKV